MCFDILRNLEDLMLLSYCWQYESHGEMGKKTFSVYLPLEARKSFEYPPAKFLFVLQVL